MDKILEELLGEGFDWDRTYSDHPAGLLVLDHNHTILKANNTMLRMLSLAEDTDLVGQKCYEVMHGTSEPPTGCVHAKVLHTNHVEEIEFVHNNSIYRIIETPLFSKTGKLVGYIHASYDITKQKLAEDKIRKENKKFETIFSKFPVGIEIVSLCDGSIMDANNYFCEMLNYSKMELTALTVYDITHPDDVKLSMEYARKAEQDGKPYRLTKRYITKFGQIRWIYLVVAPISNDAGEVEYAFAMAEDITTKVAVKEEIDKQRGLLQSYIDLVKIIMVGLDLSGRVTAINKRGRELLGEDTKDIIGKNWLISYIPEQDQPRVRRVFKSLINGNISLNGDPPNYFTNPIVTKEGRKYTIIWHNTLVRDHDGTITGIISAGEDITQEEEK